MFFDPVVALLEQVSFLLLLQNSLVIIIKYDGGFLWGFFYNLFEG